jgi:hypothetical protein
MTWGGKTSITPMTSASLTDGADHTRDCGGAARDPGLPLRIRFGGDPVQLLLVISLCHVAYWARLGALGVDADGLDDPLDSYTPGQLEGGPYRVLLVIVCDLSSLRPGHLQARLLFVDREDLSHTHYQGARYHELAHGPGCCPAGEV